MYASLLFWRGEVVCILIIQFESKGHFQLGIPLHTPVRPAGSQQLAQSEIEKWARNNSVRLAAFAVGDIKSDKQKAEP